ncbi:alpha/beta hydrolase [candidate division TA06 bacterium]|uniref:Alpha/beta hydrolase n=1 Tax=candidate division TA06 bacterium TaxID=2250710 RepID=A0A933IFW7_UNCT6|nr:alpha/beta hydrolase [candidate division TA06 bacterium]
MKPLLIPVIRIVTVLGFCAISASVAMYLLQDRMIFYPQRIRRSDLDAIKSYRNVREVAVTARDGTVIKGWFVDNGNPGRSKLLFYFGGNAEEVSYLIPKAAGSKDCSFVLMNYRGYGQSQGKPSETSLCSDALEIYDSFAGRTGAKDQRIIIMGRSIGTGVAVFLAKNRKSDGVILVSPYNDFKSLAQYHFPYLPVGLMIKYKFNSGEKAPSIKSPLMIMLGTEDKTIPPQQSRLLAQKWGGMVTIKEFEGADHNTFGHGYWQCIKEFLNQY